MAVDQADHMIKNAAVKYITWKYWHAPYLHAIALGLVVAYDMYQDCIDGYLDEDWKLSKKDKSRMSFQMFREKLSEQMLLYNPRLRKYPGDEKFRSSTKQTKRQRSSLDSEKSNDSSNSGMGKRKKRRAETDKNSLFHQMYLLASTGDQPRCCSTAEELKHHIRSIRRMTNSSQCDVCVGKSCWKCGLCNKTLCIFTKRKLNGMECFMKYHSHEFFGLSRSDSNKIYHQPLNAWRAPDANAIRRNANAINRIRKSEEENNTRDNDNVATAPATEETKVDSTEEDMFYDANGDCEGGDVGEV